MRTQVRKEMTLQEIKRLKQQILSLNYDSIRKRTKAIGLSKLLIERAAKHARFTLADYKSFYKSRHIKGHDAKGV